MKFRNLAVAGVAAMAFLGVSAARASADQPMRCEVHQRQVLRVALSIAVGPTILDKMAVAHVVNQVWEPEGLDIDWIDETAAAQEPRLDAWVVLGRRTAELSKLPPSLDGVSRHLVWVSMDTVESQLEQTLAMQMQMSRESARHLMFGSSHLIERSLGRAVAHRLGHSLMGLRHSATGLMSSSYSGEIQLRSSPAQLDAQARRMLQRRFAIGCVPPDEGTSRAAAAGPGTR